jgi:site-specific DNA-methyltransferase (adenine-specific)
MCWLYGSGFPKSLDISKAIDRAAGAEREVVGQRDTLTGVDKNSNTFMSSPRIMDITAPSTAAAKQWQGWGTALKPAVELICVAMKPLDGTFAENAEKWGTAGINIDGCRVGGKKWENPRGGIWSTDSEAKSELIDNPLGRWPANLILDEESARALDEMSGELHKRGNVATSITNENKDKTGFLKSLGPIDCGPSCNFGDSGGASRFFYTAKADRREREDGLHGFEPGQRDESRKEGNPGGDNPRNRGLQKRQNTHPTVKPLSLMRYLCRLTRTPSGGMILDPFMGSGTTGIAAIQSGRDFIGIELQEEYVEIAKARIKGACPLLTGGIE